MNGLLPGRYYIPEEKRTKNENLGQRYVFPVGDIDRFSVRYEFLSGYTTYTCSYFKYRFASLCRVQAVDHRKFLCLFKERCRGNQLVIWLTWEVQKVSSDLITRNFLKSTNLTSLHIVYQFFWIISKFRSMKKVLNSLKWQKLKIKVDSIIVRQTNPDFHFRLLEHRHWFTLDSFQAMART